MTAQRPRDRIDLTALDLEPWPRAGATSSLDALLAPTFGPPVLARAWVEGGRARLDVAMESGARVARFGCPLAPETFDELGALAIAALSEEPPRDWVIRDGIRVDLDVSHAGTAGGIASPIWQHAPVASRLALRLVELAAPLTSDPIILRRLGQVASDAREALSPPPSRKGRRRRD